MLLDKVSTLRQDFCRLIGLGNDSEKNKLSLELSEKMDGAKKFSFDFRYFVNAPSLNLDFGPGVEVKKIVNIGNFIVVRGFVTLKN